MKYFEGVLVSDMVRVSERLELRDRERVALVDLGAVASSFRMLIQLTLCDV